MSVDTELELWRREWRADRSELPDLAAAVRRRTRMMVAMLVAEVVITVVIGGGVTAWALRSQQGDVAILAAATWIFFAVAWTFGLRNRRDCWTPVSLDTAAFLDISIRRSRRDLQALTFTVVFYMVEITFCLAWIYHRNWFLSGTRAMEFLLSPAVSVVWLGTAVFFAVVFFWRQRTKKKLSYLLKLQQQGSAGVVND